MSGREGNGLKVVLTSGKRIRTVHVPHKAHGFSTVDFPAEKRIVVLEAGVVVGGDCAAVVVVVVHVFVFDGLDTTAAGGIPRRAIATLGGPQPPPDGASRLGEGTSDSRFLRAATNGVDRPPSPRRTTTTRGMSTTPQQLCALPSLCRNFRQRTSNS